MKKSRHWLFSLLLWLFILGGLIGVWFFVKTKSAITPSEPQTIKVTKRNFSASVTCTGAVKPCIGAEVRVGARISGRVDRLFANIGDVVRKGQVIAILEKAELEALVAQRQAELNLAIAKHGSINNLRPKEIEKAQMDVKQWEATSILAKKEFNRQMSLFHQSLVASQTADQAQERFSVTEAQHLSAKKGLELAHARMTEDRSQAIAEVSRAKAALEFAKVQLSYATIAASIDGVIAVVSTQEGETVAAGLSAPTFVTIINLDRLQVDAYVDEVDIGKIKVGQSALFTVDSYPAREFEGKVSAIYPKAVIQENVINYDVVVSLGSNSESILRPDMTANVSIFLEAKDNVLAIPSKAIKREQGKTVICLPSMGQKADSEITTKEIKIGLKEGQWVEVLSGLDEGQEILSVPPVIQINEP